MSASGNIRFKDNYTLSIGIENLLDKDPPCTNSNPTLLPTPAIPFQYPRVCDHNGTGTPGENLRVDLRSGSAGASSSA